LISCQDLVKTLTTGTIISPASIANAPALIGDCKIGGNELLKKIFKVISAVLKIKQHQTDIVLVRFQYSP
jgi:predicted ATPase with chaperone activity